RSSSSRESSWLAVAPKCRFQQLGALLGEDAAGGLDLVVEFFDGEEVEFAAARAPADVASGPDDTRDAAVDDGAGAHGAGFERHVERRAVEAPVACAGCGFAQGEDFRVGGRVAEDFLAVMGA